MTDRNRRLKTARIARILEKYLGTPRQAGALPAPLEMLIATILSQNTNDKNSHRAYTLLRGNYPTWDSLAKAQLKSVIATIRIGGLANQKGRRIKQTLEAVKERYGDYDLTALKTLSNEQVIEELTQLIGVGLKTASCVLLFSMKRDVFPVDTHVHRLCLRLGLVPDSSTPDKTFLMMRESVPRGKGYSFHTNLIRFGRRVCRSNNPACDVCPLYRECLFAGKRKSEDKRRSPSKANHDFMLLDNV